MGLGESDAFLSNVVDVAVGSDKRVAEDDGRSVRIRAAQAEGEGADGALIRAEVELKWKKVQVAMWQESEDGICLKVDRTQEIIPGVIRK